MDKKQNKSPHSPWRMIRPALIAGTVTVLAFFLLQGVPIARTLYRRTDLTAVKVVYDGEEKLIEDKAEIARAAEVAGMLAHRLPAKVSDGPDTYYEFSFEDGSLLVIGTADNYVLYKGKWYSGAAGTPELFRSLTESRFFSKTGVSESEAVTAPDSKREDADESSAGKTEQSEVTEGMVGPVRSRGESEAQKDTAASFMTETEAP